MANRIHVSIHLARYNLWHIAHLFRIIAASSFLLLASWAELRLQTIRGSKTAWLSKSGGDSSLSQLKFLDKGKTTPGKDSQFIPLDHGTQVYVTEDTRNHCQGRNVFVKIQVKDGDHKGIEGWICGANTTHRKAVAF